MDIVTDFGLGRIRRRRVIYGRKSKNLRVFSVYLFEGMFLLRLIPWVRDGDGGSESSHIPSVKVLLYMASKTTPSHPNSSYIYNILYIYSGESAEMQTMPLKYFFQGREKMIR
jgi:hypothetical protein